MYTDGFKYAEKPIAAGSKYMIPHLQLLSIENKELIDPITITYGNVITLDSEMSIIIERQNDEKSRLEVLQEEMDSQQQKVMNSIIHQYVNTSEVPEYFCINASPYSSAYMAIAKSDDIYYMITIYMNDEKTKDYSNITIRSRLVRKITEKDFV